MKYSLFYRYFQINLCRIEKKYEIWSHTFLGNKKYPIWSGNENQRSIGSTICVEKMYECHILLLEICTWGPFEWNFPNSFWAFLNLEMTKLSKYHVCRIWLVLVTGIQLWASEIVFKAIRNSYRPIYNTKILQIHPISTSQILTWPTLP